MHKSIHRVLTALLVAVLLFSSFATLASAQIAAPSVTGTLTGGQFDKIWLGLAPTERGSDVTLTATWDRGDPDSAGVGFFVLDPAQTALVVGGSDLRSNNLAAGSQVFGAAGNQQSATFRATGGEYTVVVYNDSNGDANFTLSAANGILSDNSDRVRDPNATETPEATAESTEAAAPAEATPALAATVAATTTTTTTTTTTAAPAATPVAPAAAVAPGQPVVVRAQELQGALPEQNDQHYLGLVPSERDADITLTLTFDPQDSSELARRLNFWVLDESGFRRFTDGTPASEVAIAAGNRTFTGDTNERVALFQATGLGEYTVIVYNNSQVPATYTLRADGGLLVDDSGQTETAKAAGATAGVTGTVTSTVTAPAAVTATTATTTTTGTARAGQPGGTYTVQAGDTIALIARDIYGDYRLYEQICAFNNIADCNRIEIGDVINLPTQAQLGTISTAPAATPAATAAATPAATVAATPAATAAVTATTTATTTATAATTATGTTGAAVTGNTLLAVAEANGNFNTLIDLVQAAGLEDELNAAGPLTIFAPTDAAFNALGAATVSALKGDVAQLRQILLFHVVEGTVASSSLTDGMEATTLQGSAIEFNLRGQTPKVQDSNIVGPDVQASNGVIHVIDKVMLPPL